jgi:hypothetical protein
LSVIRKISVGPDYKNSMHYILDSGCIGDSHRIYEIKMREINEYEIWIINKKDEIQLWKRVVNQPVQIEYHIEI